MPVYLIATINIHDRERYAQYEAGFMDIFNRYDGRMLSVDEQPECLEGDWPFTRTVLIEFASREQAMGFYHSDDYQLLAKHRHAASSANLVIVDAFSPPDA